MRKPGLIIIAALFALGCAQNAILELVITLPRSPDPAADPPWFGLIQVNRATEAGFGTPREGGGQSPVPLVLGEEPQVDCISVQATDETMDLEVRVRFCRSDDCFNLTLDTNAPERFFRLEHPFYIGRHTYWYRVIPDVPLCTVDADCEAGSCISGRCGCTTDNDCCAAGCACPTATDPAGGTCYRCEDGPDSEVPGAEPTPDSCVETVSRCHVQGCTSGDGATNFCSSRDDMPHFCETADFDRREDYPPACLAGP